MAKKQPAATHGGRRAGAGRPKVYEHLAPPTSVTLELEMRERLDKRAAKLGITRSAAIKLAVGEWLK